MASKQNGKKIKWYHIVLIVILAIIIALGSVVAIVGTHTLYQDVYKPYYLAQKQKGYAEEAATAEKGGIVFFGDSITDQCDLEKYYPGYNVFNRGISGDSTYHLLERMKDVYVLEPSVIVLLIGVNDFMNDDRPVGDVYEDYVKILNGIKINLPDTVVVCQSVYPGADGQFKVADYNDEIVELNAKIKTLAEEYDYIYADIHPYLLAPDSALIDSTYCTDGVHPNDAGYVVISEHLTPYIEQALEQYNAK